ncbi:MAG: ferritin-like domain-containing protein [Leptolyngbya sp. SIO3F4]|nr:ferritin-like domain-containing protein [Leptolyngbya sp. SIO3F4]
MSINNLFPVSGYELSELSTDHKINRILVAALGEREITHSSQSSSHPIYWDTNYFDLDRMSIFRDASELEQQQILHQLNQQLLEESLYIEQAGVGYMAKMVLMANSTQERMLYSLFAADETSHLAQLQSYVSVDTTGTPDDPFLQLLAEIVESEDRSVLLFVLQVVLEGWGLTHYRHLAKGCTDQTLQLLFQSFLHAESRHHGAGITLFNQAELSTNSQTTIVDCLATFLQMVRVGPQRVVHAIATHKGHLSRPQRIKILQELDTVCHSHQRLQLLRSIMVNTSSNIVNALEEKDLFTPLSPEEAASYG